MKSPSMSWLLACFRPPPSAHMPGGAVSSSGSSRCGTPHASGKLLQSNASALALDAAGDTKPQAGDGLTYDSMEGGSDDEVHVHGGLTPALTDAQWCASSGVEASAHIVPQRSDSGGAPSPSLAPHPVPVATSGALASAAFLPASASACTQAPLPALALRPAALERIVEGDGDTAPPSGASISPRATTTPCAAALPPPRASADRPPAASWKQVLAEADDAAAAIAASLGAPRGHRAPRVPLSVSLRDDCQLLAPTLLSPPLPTAAQAEPCGASRRAAPAGMHAGVYTTLISMLGGRSGSGAAGGSPAGSCTGTPMSTAGAAAYHLGFRMPAAQPIPSARPAATAAALPSLAQRHLRSSPCIVDGALVESCSEASSSRSSSLLAAGALPGSQNQHHQHHFHQPHHHQHHGHQRSAQGGVLAASSVYRAGLDGDAPGPHDAQLSSHAEQQGLPSANEHADAHTLQLTLTLSEHAGRANADAAAPAEVQPRDNSTDVLGERLRMQMRMLIEQLPTSTPGLAPMPGTVSAGHALGTPDTSEAGSVPARHMRCATDESITGLTGIVSMPHAHLLSVGMLPASSDAGNGEDDEDEDDKQHESTLLYLQSLCRANMSFYKRSSSLCYDAPHRRLAGMQSAPMRMSLTGQNHPRHVLGSDSHRQGNALDGHMVSP